MNTKTIYDKITFDFNREYDIHMYDIITCLMQSFM